MNWPCVGLKVSLLATGGGTLVSQQSFEMFFVGLGSFIFARGGNVPQVPPSTLRALGGTWGTFPPDVMAPGAHSPSLQADTTTYILRWKSCAPAGIFHQKGLVWSNLGPRWDRGLHAALSLSIPCPHQLGTPSSAATEHPCGDCTRTRRCFFASLSSLSLLIL